MTDLSKEDDDFVSIFGSGRALPYRLTDYWQSVNGIDTNLGYQWIDKPHRHVYDLLAEIVHLRATLSSSILEIEKLKEALKPFARIAESESSMDHQDTDTDEWFRHDGDVLLVGDFRRAALACKPDKEND